MPITFEGWKQASSYAQVESQKTTGIFYVVKNNAGGVHYEVRTSISLENLSADEKLMGKYQRGELIK